MLLLSEVHHVIWLKSKETEEVYVFSSIALLTRIGESMLRRICS